MHCNDIANLWYSPPSSLHSNQDHYDRAQSELESLQFNSLFRPFSTYPFWTLDDCHPTSCRDTNSAADAEEKHKLSIVEDRRKRRMISNRESARRSRLRKQKQLHELWSLAIHFRSLNHQLLDELNYKMKECGQILQENMLLRNRKLELLKVRDATVLVHQSGSNATNNSCMNTNPGTSRATVREAI